MTEAEAHFAIASFADLPGIELISGYSRDPAPLRHVHGEFRFGIAVSGRWTSQVRGVRHGVGLGQLQFARPGDESLCEFGPDGHGYRVLSVPTTWLRAQLEQDGSRKTGMPHFAEHVIEHLPGWQSFAATHRQVMSATSRLEATARIWALLGQLLDFSSVPLRRDRKTGEGAAIARARQRIEDDPSADLSLDTLADLSGLSSFHFLRCFRAATGLPPHSYQMACRIRLAKRLLAEGVPGGEVAAAAGFADQSHFIRHFRRFTGYTPGLYARNHKSLAASPAQTSEGHGKIAGKYHI